MFVNPNVGSVSLSSPDNHHFEPKTSAPKFMELTPGISSYLNGKELSVACTSCDNFKQLTC
ncbi:unnamed protein product [Meloidogyne enterolobii]|uniref:Uncharacterized protein n=1 Tax=Meloidogyne enterolobii TaxID=390850 RepID=A0ACB1AG88_MELEN